jgi:Cu(I)/Ag(I) efflux system membrane fusion protein
MRVEIDLDNADGRLRPGQNGRVEIQLDSPRDAISIPSAAVGRSRDGSLFCFRVADGHVVLTRISLGQDNGEQAVVSNGLQEGDVVVANANGIRDGQEIQPAPADRGTGILPPAPERR